MINMKTMQSGLVSVIIPTYKRAENLESAIRSVLNQTYQNIEIIVVDDNNDGDEYRIATSKLMQKFENNSKVKYIKHHANQNGSAARNTGIHESRGEYIAFLDDDDLSLPERISKSVEALEKAETDIGAVCVGYVKRYKDYVYKKGNGLGLYTNCYDVISRKVDLCAGSTIMYRRCCVEKVGLYDVSYKRHQDWEYLIRLFRYYGVLVLEDIEVIICVGIVGGRPNVDVVKEMKVKLFNDFNEDFSKLSIQQVELIQKNQWMHLFLACLKRKSYRKALLLKKEYKDVFKIDCADIIKIIQALAEGLFPKSLILIYKYLNSRRTDLAKYRYINY